LTVTVEVPADHKFCKHCGGVKPLDTDWHFKSRNGRQVPESRCKECQRKRWQLSNHKARGTLPGTANYTGQKKIEELSLDEIGERIADACWEGPQVVYRTERGIRWKRDGGYIPAGAEMLGRFNIGFDWRDLRGSLEA